MPYKKSTGEYVTWREFFHQWREGLEGLTPLQQCVGTQMGHIISGIGVVWGIVFSFIIGYWWMAVILIGGLVVLFFQYTGNWQKKQILKRMDLMIKEAEQNKEVQDG